MVPTVNETIDGFQVRSFDQLTTREVYEILRARADIFVGDQHVVEPDPDGIDYDSLHLFAADDNGTVTAYLRIFMKADEPDVAQMGRVLTRVHGQGQGGKLLAAGIKTCETCLHAREIYLESQKHAQGYYEKQGFVATSDDFMEAGIPHVQMRKNLQD